MLKGIKRTKNNDLVINDKGLSVLNILCILSALSVIFFFLPIIKSYDGGMSLFSVISGKDGDLFFSTSAIKGWITMDLFYPIAIVVMWAMNKKATGSRSYIFVHVIYVLYISLGFMEFILLNIVTSFGGTFFAWLFVLILFVSLIISVYGILKTGRTEIDESAVALDMNVDYAKDILNKAGSMASNVANNVSAAATKATANKTVTCDKCGAVCSESSTFCNSCGNNLDNAKKMKAESMASAQNTVICPKCGNVCQTSATFCTKCGNNLADIKAAYEEKQNYVDETAKLAREMAKADKIAATDTTIATSVTETVTETDIADTDVAASENSLKNDEDGTSSKGVSLSK